MSESRTQMKPERAIERYLTDKKPEWADSTYYNNASSLGLFLDFCEGIDLDNICEIDGFHISDFKKRRREVGEVNEMTLYNDLCSLRSFLKWSNSMGLIESWVVENMVLNDPDEKVRSEKIEPEIADQILEYLDDFEYATRRHALFALLWDTGMRLGNARSLDVDDYYPEEKYIEVSHDPDEGTPQKNKEPAEREVNLHDWTCEILDDYLRMNHIEVEDDYGRNPLFASKYGRMALSNLRTHIRRLTRPCHYTGECPHDREKSECVAVQEYNKAAQCPGSHKPHAIRRGAITHWLNEGHRKELISDRMNVSIPTLDKHYDARTESEKRDLRREMFDME
ncbi:site-specific integrase [Halorubrum sp. PV6]|uniref:tyrosine-type recombinase/integrase n=1 Tax=Halorubrum sp. PV6 TaxID=634157 RepID=UPI000F8509A2|nr:site-specific integrase [Halorubrum sp. PV6]AZQ15479.1 site-specific integrase [Halorubrum sp. PV6]